MAAKLALVSIDGSGSGSIFQSLHGIRLVKDTPGPEASVGAHPQIRKDVWHPTTRPFLLDGMAKLEPRIGAEGAFHQANSVERLKSPFRPNPSARSKPTFSTKNQD